MPKAYMWEATSKAEAWPLLLNLIIEQSDINAVMSNSWLPMKETVMLILSGEKESLLRADPLAPAFPLNVARMVSRLTRKASGGQPAVVLRPCELRAFIELCKLKQADINEVFLISYECPGAYDNRDFAAAAKEFGRGITQKFIDVALKGQADEKDPKLAAACRVCEKFTPQGADLAVLHFGVKEGLLITPQSEKGASLVEKLCLPEAEITEDHAIVLEELRLKRTAKRDEMFAETNSATGSLERLSAYLAGCINCYNCRVACPVCYCRECVFSTDVFEHEPSAYLGWAKQKGALKMPTDTLFYHLTRLAHMSTACVGCGQCSNACPNDIPVMELFRTVAEGTQKLFDYEPGRSLEEAPPLSVFYEDELTDVAGL